LVWRAKGGEIKTRCPLTTNKCVWDGTQKAVYLQQKDIITKQVTPSKINKNFLQNTHFLPPILESETAKMQEIRPNFAV
jgi:hypothetical protein